jgi:hypothetical protein
VPSKLSNFDAFHERCNTYVLNNFKNIKRFPIITVDQEAVNS